MTTEVPEPAGGIDLGNAINETLAIAPTLVHAPGVALAAAQANLSTTQTEQVAAFQRGQQLQQFMSGQDPDAQHNLFNSLSHDDQILLTQAGYQPPAAKKRSFFGTVIHDTANIGSEALHVAGAPLRAVQHVYRTVSGSAVYKFGQDITNPLAGIANAEMAARGKNTSPFSGSATTFDNGNGMQTVGAFNPLHPSSFISAWRATSHGSRAFDAQSLDSIKDKYDPSVYNLALRQVEGDSLEEITGGNPQTVQQLQKVAQDPTYKQALADLQAAQISPGRDMANQLGIKPGSEAFKLTSGTGDALFDWYADPTLVGGKLAKAGIALKWGLRANDMTRTEKLLQTPQAQRGWNGYIIPRLNAIKNSESAVDKGQALADLQRHFPNTMNLVDPLIEDARNAGRDVTMDSVTQYLSGINGFARIATGQAARETLTLPGRLSKFGEARLAISDNLHKAIDFATDGKKYLPYDQMLTPEEEALHSGAAATSNAAEAFGQAAFNYRKTLAGKMRYTARRLTTRVPYTTGLDVQSPDSLKLVRQTALTFLPTSRANELTAAFASADLAGKRTIYKGLIQELGHASGMYLSKTGSEYMSTLMRDVDAMDAKEAYSALGNDSGIYVRNTASGRRSVGGTANQITQLWAIPSFKEMQANAAKIGVADHTIGKLNFNWVDKWMGKWRTMVLYRAAFALRVSLEDDFNQFFRGNGMQLLQARVALKTAQRSVEGDIQSPSMKVIGKIADGVSALVGAPTRGLDIPLYYMMGKLHNVYDRGAELLLDPAYLKYGRKLFDGTARDRMLTGIVEEARGAARGAGDAMPEDIANDTKFGKIGYRPNGDFVDANAQGMNGAVRWAHHLEFGANDLVARHVLLNPDKPIDDIIPEMINIIKSPEYESVREGAEIANWTKDGRSVAAGEATPDEAFHDWALDTYTNFQHLLRDSKGNLIKPLVNYIKKTDGEVPSAQWLNQREIDPATGTFGKSPLIKDRPDTVTGPEFVPYTKSTAANLIQKGWDHLVAGPMNAMSRSPIMFKEYVEARKLLEPFQQRFLANGMSAENAERIVDTRAQMIAHARAIKFIHNPALRSQFSVIARNLFPFRHAEESALQRWATAIAFSPEGLRRAQLTMQGLHHSGIVTKDSSGNDYVVFPGTAEMVNLSAKLANILPGVHIAQLPIKANMGFELRFISPFLSEFGGVGTGNNAFEKTLSVLHPLIPPSGPVLGMPLSVMNHLFPESRLAQDAQDVFIEKQGQGKPAWQQFVPTVVSRIYGAFQNSSDATSQLSSSMRNAAAYMEAAGLTPAPDATPDEIDQYITRLRSWSRNLLVMRAIFGFGSPAAPTIDQFSPKADELFAAEGVDSLTDEFYKLTSEMPYEDALQTFIAMHPDDSPFTVAQSEAPSGAQMSSTTDTLNWMDSHSGLLKKYPSVAPFLMPLDSGPFNYDAYKEQLATGVRQKKSVKEFYTDLKVRTASDTYYQAKNQVDAGIQQLKAQGNSKAAEQLQAGFSAWSQQFQAVNPLFATYLAGGDERQTQKLQAIQQLQHMSESGDLVNLVGSTQSEAVNNMLGAWNTWLETKQSLYGRSDNTATNIRHETQAGVDAYINQLAQGNPQLQGLYSTLFAPLLQQNN